MLLVALCFAAAISAQVESAADEPAPPAVAQNQIFERTRNYAEEYVAGLPNFVCEQVVYQFQAGRRAKRWRKGDTLTSKLMFNDGHEERKLELVNSRPVGMGTHPWRTPLRTEGEFGMLLENVFGTESEPVFEWAGWETLAGKRLAVFDYSIDKAHSTLRLSLSDLAKAVVPYRGSVYSDPESGEIWRITNTVYDIPPSLRTKSVMTTVDYGEVEIGGKRYLLPVRSTVLLTTDVDKIRNEMEFTGYQKFETNSTITFGTDTDTNSPPPQ